MKIYAVEIFDQYYPTGPSDDIVAIYDNKQAALDHLTEIKMQGHVSDFARVSEMTVMSKKPDAVTELIGAFKSHEPIEFSQWRSVLELRRQRGGLIMKEFRKTDDDERR